MPGRDCSHKIGCTGYRVVTVAVTAIAHTSLGYDQPPKKCCQETESAETKNMLPSVVTKGDELTARFAILVTSRRNRLAGI